MQKFNSTAGGIDSISNTVVVLGYFDGVHLGHRELLRAAREKYPDSRLIVRIFKSLPKADCALTTLDEKLELLKEAGADEVILDDFESLRSCTGEEFFVKCVLPLSPCAVVCGYNYRFGTMASCTVAELAKFASAAGVTCLVVPEFTVNDGISGNANARSAVSSSKIRSLLSSGEVKKASELLGYYYFISGEVIHGKQLGRTIDFPTINQLPVKGKLLPPAGIYSCIAEIIDENCIYGGVCNIGSRPTVNSDGSDVTIETYLFGYSGDLYGRNVKISFVERLRGEKKFSSVSELREAIANDAENAKKSLAGILITK